MDTTKQICTEEEKKRVQNVLSYALLDSHPSDEFDDITKSATIIFDVPYSEITLIDDKMVNLKSNIGMNFDTMSKDLNICTYAISQKDLVVIDDTFQDERFKNNYMVLNFPFIRFYAVMPLVSPEGFNIGTLCVMDRKPGSMSEEKRFVLKALAKQVMNVFELRKQNEELVKLYEQSKCLSQMKEEFFSNMSCVLLLILSQVSLRY